MMRGAVVLAKAGRPIRLRECTAVDEFAGVPALTLPQLPRDANLFDLAAILEITNPLHGAPLLGTFP